MLDIAPDIAAAIAARKPVVALESTIVTHGMPYPRNLEMARGVEQDIRDGGALPATIAVLDGRCRVGLPAESLAALASRGDAAKASRRDLAAIVAAGGTAGTTVAATMFLAARAGIGVFATGGIGGVHRGGERSLDISADLLELAVSPVCVVCAGCKSILDIPRTLEVLETQGVPVLGFRTDRFPAFFSRDGGALVEHRRDTAAAVADVLRAHRALALPGGVLVANPVPEADALPEAEIEAAIVRAVAEAEVQGIGGKAATPFLLRRLVEITGGRSLRANISLVRNNARLAAAIAVALAG